MIFKWLGLSIKSGEIKTEEKEVSITADKQLYYYQKSYNPKKESNALLIKPIKLDEAKH